MKQQTSRVRRDALFTLADARGNNPHGTSEQAGSEGRRLNAKRYETVRQLDQQLDTRARRFAQVSRQGLGTAPQAAPVPASGPSFLETLIIFAAGAGLVWLFTRKDKDGQDGKLYDHVDDIGRAAAVSDFVTQFVPNPTPSPVTVVLSNPLPPGLPAPAPGVVNVVSEEVKPKARRQKRVPNPENSLV